MIMNAEKLSESLDRELNQLCAQNPLSDACRTGINSAIKYIAMRDAWKLMNKDVDRSSKETFDYLYNSAGAKDRFVNYFNTIDNRADFFGASDMYEKNKWFGGAEFVSRAPTTGLGADGHGSWFTFGLGKILGNPDIYGWRKEAGDALMNKGFANFKELYNSRPNSVQWDIKQLKDEQKLLQPIHEKYLSNYTVFPWVSKMLTSGIIPKITIFGQDIGVDEKSTQPGGIDILDYKSRVRYGCKLLGYTAAQGCQP